jgi:hypothetical protein
LDFLGFIRPNRDFSMGCEQKNKKIDSRLKLCAKRLNPCLARAQSHFSEALQSPASPANRKNIARISLFAKQLSTLAERVADFPGLRPSSRRRPAGARGFPHCHPAPTGGRLGSRPAWVKDEADDLD